MQRGDGAPFPGRAVGVLESVVTPAAKREHAAHEPLISLDCVEKRPLTELSSSGNAAGQASIEGGLQDDRDVPRTVPGLRGNTSAHPAARRRPFAATRVRCGCGPPLPILRRGCGWLPSEECVSPHGRVAPVSLRAIREPLYRGRMPKLLLALRRAIHSTQMGSRADETACGCPSPGGLGTHESYRGRHSGRPRGPRVSPAGEPPWGAACPGGHAHPPAGN